MLQANRNVVVDAACEPAGEADATDPIALAAGVTYRLTLAGSDDLSAQGDLDIEDSPAAEDLVMQGSGSILANASSPKDRVLHVLTGASVRISGVIIREHISAVFNFRPGRSGRAGLVRSAPCDRSYICSRFTLSWPRTAQDQEGAARLT